MKPTVKNSPLSFFCRRAALQLGVVLGCVALVHSLPAQIAITTISTTTTDLNDQNINGTRFENTTTAVSSFLDAAGNIYTANTVAGAAYIRRNTDSNGNGTANGAGDNANNSSVWYDQGTQTDRFSAPYATTYSDLLLGNNLLRGSDNTFANGTGVADGNIERLDFVFGAGIVASSSTAFAVFDRGAAGAHDSVKIAVITGWNSGTNLVTSYGGNLIGVNSVNYGSANPSTDFTYNLFRYSNGNALGSPDYWDDNTETGTQGIGGTIISMTDLGIAAGTTIYGYSLMGYDVTNGGNMANLVDWNNTTYYLNNTTNATGTGGIDLSAVNGVLYNRAVPEPSTYGLIFTGIALCGWCWRKRKTAAQTRA